MKITCSRRDDILKEKEEYLKVYNERKARYDAQNEAYNNARDELETTISDNILHQLDKFRMLQFDVNVVRRWGKGLGVQILCNEHNKFDDSVALSWNITIELDSEGNIRKESSSWSGLKATTDEQLESLSQSLEALKYINKIDWVKVLSVKYPKYEEYVSEDDPDYNKPDFDSQLLSADIEDAIGQPVLIPIINGSSKYYRGNVYRAIISETPKQYRVLEIHETKIDEVTVDSLKKSGYEYSISKEKFKSDIDRKKDWIYLEG